MPPRQPVYKGTDILAAVRNIDRHVAQCPVCKTWKPFYLRNGQCDSLRILVNGLLKRWHHTPSAQQARQASLFDQLSDVDPDDPPPF